MSDQGPVTIDLLKDFLEVSNRYDVEDVMAYFSDDCVVYMPSGVGPLRSAFLHGAVSNVSRFISGIQRW